MTSLNFRFANQAERFPDDLRAEAGERALVDRIRAGDMHAFETLYRSYWNRSTPSPFATSARSRMPKTLRRKSFSGSGAAALIGCPRAR